MRSPKNCNSPAAWMNRRRNSGRARAPARGIWAGGQSSDHEQGRGRLWQGRRWVPAWRDDVERKTSKAPRVRVQPRQLQQWYRTLEAQESAEGLVGHAVGEANEALQAERRSNG